MRSRGIGWTLVVAGLGAVSPGRAVAFDYTGRIGLGYDRSDTWNGPVHTIAPTLQLNGGLDTTGFLVAPGVLDWNGRIGYDTLRSNYAATGGKTDGLSYGARLGILDTREARASVIASAGRTRSDYSSDAGEIRTTGSMLSDAYNVSSRVAVPGLPSLTSSFSYTNSLWSGLGQAERTDTAKGLELGTVFGQAGLDSKANYRAQWEDGSLAAANFAAQLVDLAVVAKPAELLDSSVHAGYFVRQPSVLAAGNPRMEDTIVGWDIGTPPGAATRTSLAYGYRHSLATGTSLDIRELINHSASASYSRRVSPEWLWSASVGGALGEDRVGSVQSSGANQTIGVSASWQRPQPIGVSASGQRPTLGASLGVTAGALEPAGASAVFAYGGTASGNASWMRPGRTFALSYGATYNANLDAREGWTSNQFVSGETTNEVTQFLSWSARLQAFGTRGDGIFGSAASRSISAGGAVTYRRASLNLQAGTSDALTGALSNPLTDGLFLPASYNTHSRYAGVNASVPLAAQLTMSAVAKYTLLSGPATPDQREALLGGVLRYAVGAFTFSLEDRYTMGGPDSFAFRINTVFVRAMRTFGGR